MTGCFAKLPFSGYFEKQGVCIVGASTKKDSPGFTCSYQMIEAVKGSAKKVFLVNPKGGEVLGHKLFKDVEDVPHPFDDLYVVLLLSPPLTLVTVKKALKLGIRYFLIMSGGFAEIDENGAAIQREIAAACAAVGARVIGPNCVGIFSPGGNLDSFILPAARQARVQAGPIGMFSQSGALCSLIMNMLHSYKWTDSLNTCISFGNACDVNENDTMEYFEKHTESQIVWCYSESFKDARRFIKSVRSTTGKKPVVMIKANRTEAGARASLSHTGSIASNEAVTSSILHTSGVLRVDTFEDVIHTSRLLLEQPLPKGRRCGIVSNAGGVAVMTTDFVEMHGLELATPSAQTKKKFYEKLPSIFVGENPFDLTGSCTATHFMFVIELMMEDPNIDIVALMFLDTTPLAYPDELAKLLRERVQKVGPWPKTFICSQLAEYNDSAKELKELRDVGMPMLERDRDVCEALRHACEYSEFLDRKKNETDTDVVTIARDEKFVKMIAGAKASGRLVLSEPEAANMFSSFGIPVPKSKLVQTADEAETFLKELNGSAVVVKLVSPDVIHKSDVGAVFVNLKTSDQVRECIEHLCKKFANCDIVGYIINEFIPDGTEMMVGGLRDKCWGPVVSVGLGGTFVEILKDVQFEMAPLSRHQGKYIISRLKNQRIVDGFRGAPKVDIDVCAEIAAKVGAIMNAYDEIKEVDINPIIFYEGGCSAVDIRIVIN